MPSHVEDPSHYRFIPHLKQVYRVANWCLFLWLLRTGSESGEQRVSLATGHWEHRGEKQGGWLNLLGSPQPQSAWRAPSWLPWWYHFIPIITPDKVSIVSSLLNISLAHSSLIQHFLIRPEETAPYAHAGTGSYCSVTSGWMPEGKLPAQVLKFYRRRVCTFSN